MKFTNVLASSAAWRGLLSVLLCASILMAVAPLAPAVAAGVDAQAERAVVHQALLDLSNPWTVMCVAAHPDDEDGATLTMLRRKYGVHTVTVFSTFGEGGQNAVGPELYEELGAIRARETLAAAEIQGSEPWFLGLRDFGFSKSAAEAFRVWGHDEALRRMVLKIRTLHPDVIITNHDTLSGHGHHQATGRLVLEAFDAAADARRFPEQLREAGVTAWQPQRLFVRVKYEEGTGSRDLEQTAERDGKVVAINPNERDAVRGTTYAEQALAALHQHASQGPWPQTVPEKGAPVIRYRLAREAKAAAPLPANAPIFLEGLRLPPQIAIRLAPPTIEGRPLFEFASEPERVFKALVLARKAGYLSGNVSESSNEPHQRLIYDRLQRALAAASGITLTLATRDALLFPDTPANFVLTINNKGKMEATADLKIFDNWTGRVEFIKGTFRLAPAATISQPITSRILPDRAEINVPHAAHLYDGRFLGQHAVAIVNINIEGESFLLFAPTRIDIAPAIEITGITPSPLVLTPSYSARPSTFKLHLVNHQSLPFAGRLSSESSLSKVALMNEALNMGGNTERDVTVPIGNLSHLLNLYQGTKSSTGDSQSFTVTRLNTPEPITKQVVSIVWTDARVAPRLRVGYVRSFDDTLRNALVALGVEAKELTIEDVQTGELKSFDTIIIDNRGYQAHPELVVANERLLEYARAGGTLIVFYHKANEWNPDPKKNRPQLAPYPLKLGNARVTEEIAPITFTEPQNALLNFPNKIEAKDFDGWIQERGLYYPQEWDAHYSAPLATSDAGEATLRGGLLATGYGSGHYIYTSMVWYRQLRAGVPGAYRLFANMISYGHQSEGMKAER